MAIEINGVITMTVGDLKVELARHDENERIALASSSQNNPRAIVGLRRREVSNIGNCSTNMLTIEGAINED